MLNIIVAHDDNYGIGLNNSLPWNIKKDMRYFREKTKDNVVVMGYNTYMSIPKKFRPLPDRVNIVMTSNHQEELKDENVVTTNDLDFIKRLSHSNNVWIIGGQTVYDQFLNDCDLLYATEIKGDFQCDAFFPSYRLRSDFIKIGGVSKEEDSIEFDFNVYRRKQ